MDNEFKVVRILDEYRIIINAGSQNGINEGDLFDIHGVIDNVYDPDSKELLGTIDGIKGKVKPIEIYEKMSVCRNSEMVFPLQNALMNTTTLQMFIPSPKKLNVDKEQISNPELYEPIQIGDKAVLKVRPKTLNPETQDTASESPIEESKANQD